MLHGVDPCPIVESDKCLKKIVSQNWNESMDLDLYEGKTSSEFPLSPEVYFVVYKMNFIKLGR